MIASNLSRRQLLKAAGVSFALPLLEASLPRPVRGAAAPSAIRRMICCCTTLGIHAENFFPQQAGRDYELPAYLEPLKELRNHYTVISGVSHPDVDGGHSSEASYLTAAPHPGASSFRNTISVDQLALEKLPPSTRFSSLMLNTSSGSSISVSRSGVLLPSENRPSELFKRLFVNGNAKEVAEQTRRLQDGQSIMDTVQDEAKRLQKRSSATDRAKLEEYFSTVREVEQRLHQAEDWTKKPKPKVDIPPPTDVQNANDFVNRTRLMFDMMHLALQTDSTRIITLRIQGHNSVPPIEGITQDWHNLSHHGKDPEKLAQLKVIELEQMKLLANFLAKLQGVREGEHSLLDNSVVLYGSNLGNASSHDTKNMPVMVAGGAFRHGQHLVFDSQKNAPLPNLFVSMLQHLGIETDKFASSTGTLSGLELRS